MKRNKILRPTKWYVKVLRVLLFPLIWFFNRISRLEPEKMRNAHFEKSIIKMGIENQKDTFLGKSVGFVKEKIGYILTCMGVVATGTVGNKFLGKLLVIISKIKIIG